MHNFSKYKVISKNNLDFSPIQYSKFKYGHSGFAKKFACELGEELLRSNDFLNLVNKYREIVVLSSPFSFIKTASTYISEYLFYYLSDTFFEDEIIITFSKTNRKVSYIEDYGQMNALERFQLIGKDNFSCDYELLTNKLILAVDDIKVTGTHEKIVKNLLQPLEENSHIIYTYYISIENQEIEPQFENYLNNYFINSLGKVLQLINDPFFQYNTRVVKFIIGHDFKLFSEFIREIDMSQIFELYNLALGNQYYIYPKMKENIKYLKKIIELNTEKLDIFTNSNF